MPLPTAFSTPYNISDFFPGLVGGRGSIVVSNIRINTKATYKEIFYR
jgi:hypothetical protein